MIHVVAMVPDLLIEETNFWPPGVLKSLFCESLFSRAIILIILFEAFENAIAVLPITYQNKTKMPGKNRKWLVYL